MNRNKHEFSLIDDQNGEEQPSQEQSSSNQSQEQDQSYRQSPQQFNTKSHQDSINYNLNPADYLTEITKLVDRKASYHSSGQDSVISGKQDHPDKQIQSIINQVLNKRRRISRMTNSNVSDNSHNNNKIDGSGLTQIEVVNKRIRKQNEELMNNIKKIASRLKKFTYSKLNQNMVNHNKQQESIQASQLIESRQKQLEKLKGRLDKAQKTNSRMQLQLSKLQQSRKSRKRSQSNHNVIKNENNQYQIVINCPTCQIKKSPQASIDKFNTLKVESDFSSPVRKDLYSPIMQFQEYSLKNEPTISLYDNSLQKTSQFGFQLPPQVYSKQIQTQIDLEALIEEQSDLDDQIIKLEEKIRKNNSIISQYETVLIKQVI